MRRMWIGLALLSTSWLWGLGYYHETSWPLWALAVLGATLLLAHAPITLPKPAGIWEAIVLLLPAVAFLRWPHRAGPLLLVAGLLLCAVPIPRRWPRMLGLGVVLTGALVLVQSLAMVVYANATARSHELPRFLAHLLAALTRVLGAEVTLDGTTLALRTVRAVHRLGATWELLLDPATACFLVGGIVLLSLTHGENDGLKERSRSRIRPRAAFLLIVLVWLPVRAAILISVFLHRDFRTEYNEPFTLMNQFWSTWLHLILLAGPVFLSTQFIRKPAAEVQPASSEQRYSWGASLRMTGLVFIGALLLTAAWLWNPTGPRKAGRVLVDEQHSRWEPTQRAYDVNWYGPEAGYNYACIYDYCSRFYDMSRLEAPLDANTLDDCDILVVKTPTIRYDPNEVAQITDFVEDGGGLLLIGDHTNVFTMGTCLNDIARSFGFTFRHDCLWHIDRIGEQVYQVPVVPHPIVQNMSELDFATSCSIDPGDSRGRAVIQAAGLRSLPAAYHVGNFMPPIEDRADARYGSFIQLWAAERGTGRVVAFTDSTIFSNFATFEPGKAELMLGMLEWLNHHSVRRWPGIAMAVGGVMLMVLGVVTARSRPGAWLLVLAVAVCGGVCAAAGVRIAHARAVPAPKELRPYVQVVIDRTVCDAPLSRNGAILGQANGFAIFERWILRLGYFISRRRGSDAFAGDLLVLFCPDQRIDERFRERLVEYVSAGGRVLLLDSPENTGSTANSLLYPFGLSVERNVPISGPLLVPSGWPAIQVNSACRVAGGTPFVTVANTPVAAQVNHGRGTVAVVGFGSTFSDAQMGMTGEVIPDSNLRRLFDLEFELLRACTSGLQSAEAIMRRQD